MQYKVLIYQNNAASDLITYLKAKDFLTIVANSANILDLLPSRTFDIVILDGANSDDRYELVKTMRSLNNKIGIVFMTKDIIKGDYCNALESGADAYFSKPYDLEDIAAQLRALIRRSGPQVAPEVYQIGEYTMNPATRELTIGDYTVKVPPKEALLLAMLCDHEDQLLTKDVILRTIWVEDNYFNGRCMDVSITHLRNYLKFDHRIKIENVRGKGFIFRTK